MRIVLAILLFAAAPALAQTPAPAQAPMKGATCPDCGVVRSVRAVSKETRPPESSDSKPSGLVATVPLGGGGKAQIGSSTKLGKEAATVTMTWEVIVRLDDGRFRLFVLDEPPDVQQDDKVRIEEGRIVPR